MKAIVMKGTAVLERPTMPVLKFDLALKKLIQQMREAMNHANGVGLAAPQLGYGKSIFVWKEKHGLIVEAINPTVLEQSGQHTGPEGCLSLPGKLFTVTRPTYIKFHAYTVAGEGYTCEQEGYYARVICHEVDHLNGVLICNIGKEGGVFDARI